MWWAKFEFIFPTWAPWGRQLLMKEQQPTMGASHKCVYLYVWFGLVEESQSGVTAAVWSQRDEGLQSLQTQTEVGSPETWQNKRSASYTHALKQCNELAVRVWFDNTSLCTLNTKHTHTHWLLKDCTLRNQSAWGCNHLLFDIRWPTDVHSIRPTGLLSQTKVIKK